MTQKEFENRYENYSTQIQEYMKIFSNELYNKYGEIPEIFILTFDMIAGNLVIMCEALDEIKKSGIVGKDNYRGEKKSTALSAFITSENTITNLVKEFGWTPSSKSRIRENTDKADVQKFLEDLTR